MSKFMDEQTTPTENDYNWNKENNKWKKRNRQCSPNSENIYADLSNIVKMTLSMSVDSVINDAGQNYASTDGIRHSAQSHSQLL